MGISPVSLKPRDLLGLLLALAIPLTIGSLSALTLGDTAMTWYQIINRPGWAPPGRVFGPVWTALYILMGVALWLVWQHGVDRPGVALALMLFTVQLILNAMWAPLFFGLDWIMGGLVVAILLWITLLATMVQFYRVRRSAGLMLVPYLLWVTFAVGLNFSIWQLNR